MSEAEHPQQADEHCLDQSGKKRLAYGLHGRQPDTRSRDITNGLWARQPE